MGRTRQGTCPASSALLACCSTAAPPTHRPPPVWQGRSAASPPPPPPPPVGDPGAHRRAVAAPPRASYDARRRGSAPTGGGAAPPVPPWGDRRYARRRASSVRRRAVRFLLFLLLFYLAPTAFRHWDIRPRAVGRAPARRWALRGQPLHGPPARPGGHTRSSLQATAPTERHSVRRLLPNRRPTDAILLQSCSVLGAGSRDFRQDRAAHVIEDGIGCSGLGSLGEKACEYKLQSNVGRP